MERMVGTRWAGARELVGFPVVLDWKLCPYTRYGGNLP